MLCPNPLNEKNIKYNKIKTCSQGWRRDLSTENLFLIFTLNKEQSYICYHFYHCYYCYYCFFIITWYFIIVLSDIIIFIVSNVIFVIIFIIFILLLSLSLWSLFLSLSWTLFLFCFIGYHWLFLKLFYFCLSSLSLFVV